MKIKRDLYDQLIKIKRQKKGVVSYLINKKYSKSFAENIAKNWKTLEVIGINDDKSVRKNPPPLPKSSKTNIKNVSDDSFGDNEERELVLNISEGGEVAAELSVRQTSHPKFFLGTLINVLKKAGAKVTSNKYIDNNNIDNFSGFSISITQ